ncbi:glycosyltransferase family 4 protein [Winogradskyella endarachnes]|uniref:Undecaprenyl/decaprenyl-phosphate alpha-N-acetylglucosaminyl 1-phosphate transferase n=1 Tax=Winogradskyella endarachnes TaxID=2681965 RepID=A0A6L6UAE7_9FLAO|nr:MraY family glycosyltransferase [Winogradskyella endarachnes]MUU77882.1 undecaprenyl/decaprenyl-phosphate alpha-N-acetylglucosaminyl 1-phosphate transferase [Winogradskyella endarachnes]
MVKELLENFNPIDYVGFMVFIAVAISLIISFASYPAILLVALKKNLLDKSGDRSSHTGTVPNLGGIGIYLSIVVSITITGAPLETKSLFLILGGITVLFFLGLKDDILILSPRKKLIGQLLAAFLLIIFTDTRIYGFSGILGISIMPYWVSVGFTLFVYLLIINAFNLIDGIDGLAGSLALIACIAFGIFFYKYEDISMVVLAASSGGALISFLYFNFSRRRKMFMGDSGSMILGFILAVFAVRFIDSSESKAISLFHNSSPVIVLSILFFPLLDTLRIFFIRIVVHKKSPFAADNNHLHHRFLKCGFSHKQTTITIVVTNVVLIFVAYFSRNFEINWQLILLLISGTILYSLYFIFDWLRGMKSN